MTEQMTEQMTEHTTTVATCDPTRSTTKTLLAYGAIAGPIYVLASLAQALTRDGFDLTRHQWSLLSNGSLGWIQITNFVLTGLMVLAFAAGLRRALQPRRGGAWAPRLIGVYGVSLIGAGIFRADAALGFPPGTPDGATEVSWHGMLHFVCGAVGFTCLIAACFVVASRFANQQRRDWATYSRATGVLLLAGFVAVAVGAGAAWANVAFTVAVILVWTWVSAVAVHLYHQTRI